MDGTIMVWDSTLPDDLSNATSAGLADEAGAIQTYWGHDGRAIRDCAFPVHSASSFVSCGYDGFGLLWDTETGSIVNRYTADNARVAVNAGRFKTDDDNQLLLAFADRKLRHWDIRQPSDKPAQVYDFHQSSVSSVLFCEHGNKFVSTGEDRKLLVWDWSVPSPSKIISELWIPGMPTTAAHPDTMSFVAVGLDNRLFQFRVHGQTGVVKKSGECSPNNFRVAGFACEPAYSACGKNLACGDGNGNIHFLRVKSAFQATNEKNQQIEGAHSSSMPVSCVVFHPCYEGVLLSVSWDGSMKMWS
jgi:pre-mRNA-processing factor 17